ncbi:MAG: T9SS type A sorting domain-containing protein [Chitinophagaceae bacterium]
MKKIFTFLVILCVNGKTFSQSCKSLGCAKAQTGLVIDGTLPDIFVADNGDVPGSCFVGKTYKQVFWEYFYSTTGGDFVQTFTETAGGTTLDLDYVVFDIGTTAPTDGCPSSVAAWTELNCNYSGARPTGPGNADDNNNDGNDGSNTLTTIAGHYYAIAIVSAGTFSSSFDASAPTLGGLPLDASNCVNLIALPVDFKTFNASLKNCAASLSWNVENESNLKAYEVESSVDGKTFNTIATVQPTNGSGGKTYSFQQENVTPGKVYYRIKMIDLDGKFTLSKIITLNVDCSQIKFGVYPNPVTDVLNVNIPGNEQTKVVARLFDINGKLIYTGNMTVGTNKIPMGIYSKGIYLLRLVSDTETRNIKVVK